MGMSKTTKTIIEMVEKHGGLHYLGKCSQYKGYVISARDINGNVYPWLVAKTQKEMIEKLKEVM